MANGNEIRSLTSMRGVATLGVVALHCTGFFVSFRAGEGLLTFVRAGYLWVDFFFVLSGFILSYVYVEAFGKRVAASIWKNFIIARIARIYPLHLGILIFYVILEIAKWSAFHLGHSDLVPFASEKTVQGFVTSLFLVHAWGFHSHAVWSIPSWSISAELFAYLLFPFFIRMILGAQQRWTLLNTLAATSLTTLGILEFFNPEHSLDLITGPALARCLAEFLVGVYTYQVFKYYQQQRHSLLIDYASWIQVASAAVLLLGMRFHWFDTLLVPFIALLVASLAVDRGLVARFLHNSFLFYLGKISYSIYLGHMLVFSVFDFVNSLNLPMVDLFFASKAAPLQLVVRLACVFYFAKFTYDRIEEPGRRIWRHALSTHLRSWISSAAPSPKPESSVQESEQVF